MAITTSPTTILQPLKLPLFISSPIALGTPIAQGMGPRAIAVKIAWDDYGASSTNPVAIDIDLASGNPAQPLDKIRSIFIDNSFSFTPIFVLFPDTQFTAICPANSIACIPVLTNQATKAVVYADEFDDRQLPHTTIHFTNINQAGWAIGTGEYVAPIPEPSLVYTDTANVLPAAGVANFGTRQIGSEDVSRVVFVAVAYRTNGAAGTIAGVNIGGNPATQVANVQNLTLFDNLALYRLAVPAGSTAPITASLGGGAGLRAACFVWASYFLANGGTPHDVESGSNSGAPLDVLLDTPTKGVGIGIQYAGNGSGLLQGIGNTANVALVNTHIFGRGHDLTSGGQLSLKNNGVGGGGANIIIGASFA